MSIVESMFQKVPNGLKPELLATRQAYRRLRREVIALSPMNRFIIAKYQKMAPLKLNIGCGKAKLAGWVNVDIEPGADLILDVRKGIPFSNDTVDLIYNEHFLEHLSFEEGERILLDFYRCLKKQGLLRIAVPDLDYIVRKYDTDWENQDWLSWPEYKFLETKGQMINIAFRWWGHKYLYNEEDLKKQLIKVGFGRINRCEWNKSNHAELCNLETRRDSNLIIEAEK